MATIMRKLNIISRCEAMYRSEKSSVGLPGIYHSYILAICNCPGLNQEALAKKLCVNKSSVTRHLAYLEKNGYIQKKSCPEDRRELQVFPTDKMLSVREEVLSITREWNALIAEGISDEELEIFHRISDKLLDKSYEIIYKGGGK